MKRNKQLQTYVERVHLEDEFEYSEIYVFYLPLTDDKSANQDDWDWLTEKNVCHKKITFGREILRWLNAVLSEWPEDLPKGMHDNLSHYRNLIKYLDNKQKESKMSSEILKQLKIAEEKSALPTLSDVEALKQSLEPLKRCMEQMLRAKLLLEIRSILQRRGEEVWLCLESKPTEKIDLASPYDERFETDVDLCIGATDSVTVCVGANQYGFWLGYMRSGSRDKQKEIEPIILSEAQERLQPNGGAKYPWYAWDGQDVTYGNDCVANYSLVFANSLVEMRNRLVDRLKVQGVRS